MWLQRTIVFLFLFFRSLPTVAENDSNQEAWERWLHFNWHDERWLKYAEGLYPTPKDEQWDKFKNKLYVRASDPQLDEREALQQAKRLQEGVLSDDNKKDKYADGMRLIKVIAAGRKKGRMGADLQRGAALC